MKNNKYLIWVIPGIIILLFLVVFLIVRLKSSPTAPESADSALNLENQEEPVTGDVTVNRPAIEDYLRQNIGRLSPEPAVLGGTFYVTSIIWQSDGSTLVEYEDGHIALKAEAIAEYDARQADPVKIKSFTIVQ